MKKVLFGLFALSTLALAESPNLYLRVGIDTYSRFDEMGLQGTKINSDKNDSTGYELAVEMTKNYGKDFEFGLGIAFQDHGKPEVGYRGKDSGYYVDENDTPLGTYEDDEWTTFEGYKSIPLYVTGKYKIQVTDTIKTYLKLDLGYSFNFDEGNVQRNYSGINTPNDESAPYPTSGADKYSVNVKDGLYLGFGIGVEYNNFVTDVMYKFNKAEANYDEGIVNIKKDIDYSRVTLSFGYKFNF